eukprot:10595562-Ditylum_brightwellii.AAC.1
MSPDGTGFIVSDTSFADCYGVGETVHIASSTFDEVQGADYQVTDISLSGTDDVLSTVAADLSTIPLITEEQSADFATEVMFMDRNVQIT